MKVYILIGLLVFAGPAWAEEVLTLTAPLTRPSTNTWEIVSFSFDRSGEPSVTTIFLDTVTGERKQCQDTGSDATTFISAFNTADHSTASLQKQIMERAITSTCLTAGAVAGTPD